MLEKTFYLLLSLLAFSAPRQAAAQGIEFQDTTLDAVFEQARAEGKRVFIDLYTQWCGPCHQMARTVFLDSIVGQTVNASFVSCKVDAERGEGRDLRIRFNALTFPCYLFFEADGRLCYFSGAGMSQENFLREISNAKAGTPDNYPQYNLAQQVEREMAETRRPARLRELLPVIEQSLAKQAYLHNQYLAARLYADLGEAERARQLATEARVLSQKLLAQIENHPYTKEPPPELLLRIDAELEAILAQ